MRSSFICAVATVSLIMMAPFSMANEQAVTATQTNVNSDVTQVKAISKADKAVIEANVLCQNIPAIDPENLVQARETYTNYIEQVSELFGNNAKDIKSETIGINKDHQMSYELNSPINVVGITFNTVNIITLKEQNYNYYQITATKKLTDTDMGLVNNIPQNDKLTVSTKDKQLSIMCNVRTPMLAK